MELFLKTLLTMSATASLAALVILALRLPLKQAAPRRFLCLLWLVVLLRMVCPVSFSLPVSLIPAPVAQGTFFRLPAQETPQQTAPAPAADPQAAAPQPNAPWPAFFTALWAAGALAMAGRAVYLEVKLRRRLADAILVEDNVYETDQTDTPFLLGFFRPKVYLPAGLDPALRPYVLLHEAAHLRRHDHWWKPLAYLALCLHWFNPLLHLAFRAFCQDLETAADQAVVRSFDRAQTAAYADALLRLGRGEPRPAPAPLAFGKGDIKARVRAVLVHHRASLQVALIAVLLSALVALLLLANPSPSGSHGNQMEGVTITQASLQVNQTPLPLPDDLRDDLVALLADYDQRDYTPLDTFALPDGALLLSDLGGGTQFCFLPDETRLVRVNHDGYSAIQKSAPLDPALEQDPRLSALQAHIEAYFTTGWAQELYALKTPYIGDHIACGQLIGALGISQAVGPATMALETSAQPYGLTLSFSQPMTQAQAHRANAYLNFCAPLFLGLVENAGWMAWELPVEGQSHPVSSRYASPWDAPPSQEEFLAAWQTQFQAFQAP